MSGSAATAPRSDVAAGWRLIDAAIAMHRRLMLRRRRSLAPYLMLAPAVITVGVLAVGLIYLAWSSLHGFDAFRFRQGGFSFQQYSALFSGTTGGYNRTVLLRTLSVAAVVTILSAPIGLPIAYAIVRVRSNLVRGLMLVMLLVPFLMGEAVRAFGWQLILGENGGLSWALKSVGAGSADLLGTSFAVGLGLVQVSIPLATLLCLPAVRRIDPDLERAAATLGARRWRVWWHILVPLARPGMAVGAAIVFLLAVAEFDLPKVVGQGRVPFVANAVSDIYTGQGNLNLAAAFSIVLVVIATVCVIAMLAVGLIGRRRPRVPTAATPAPEEL